MKKIFSPTWIFNFMVSLTLSGLPMITTVAHAETNPWPLAETLPFPWDNIEGTWSESSSLFTFTFKVIENSSGENSIKIQQIHPETGAILAQGMGFENSRFVVVAGMTGGPLGQYLLTVRLMQNVFCWDDRKVTGVTIESLDQHQLIHHFEIHKVTELPLTDDQAQDYNQQHPRAKTSGHLCGNRPPTVIK